MRLHQLECLGVHDRLDRLQHGLAHDLADLGPVPPLGDGEHRFAHPHEAVFVGAEVEVDQLRDGRPGHQAPVDQAALHEGPAEGRDGGPVDDRLVEIEEGRLHIPNGTGEGDPGFSHRDGWLVPGVNKRGPLNWAVSGVAERLLTARLR